MKTLTIEGAAISDIASFYAELNRVFMESESWTLGHSLDALDDMLYGGYGALKGNEPVRLIWRDIEQSREALGLATTRAYYQAKLARPDRYDTASAQGTGRPGGGGGADLFRNRSRDHRRARHGRAGPGVALSPAPRSRARRRRRTGPRGR